MRADAARVERRSELDLRALVKTESARQSVQRIARALGRPIELLASRDEALRLAREDALLILEGDEPTAGSTLSLVRRMFRVNPDLLIAAMPRSPESSIEDLYEAGALVVIVETQSSEEAAELIRAAESGMAILDPRVAGVLVRRIQGLSQLCVDQNVDVKRCTGLTPREREVAALLAVRATNEQISQRLSIAIGTVKTHVHNILEKLEVDGRSLAGVYWRLYTGDGGGR